MDFGMRVVASVKAYYTITMRTSPANWSVLTTWKSNFGRRALSP